MNSSKPVHLREVWADNLVYEFFLIKEAISRFPLVALDTEFPGTLFQLNRDKSSLSHATPYENYCLMKWNVDLLKIIQLGMTLSDSPGNLPSFGTEFHYAWQFNFRDFNIEHDHHNEESIGLLERQGIDLKKNREKGIDSSDFGRLILSSGLVSNNSSITWITFHGAYDFGFLIKILTRRELPSDMRFLHDKVKPHVVHRDIRASSVLLDEEFGAHLMGVGLSKFMPWEVMHERTMMAGGTYGLDIMVINQNGCCGMKIRKCPSNLSSNP
ncbi:hypothetical protein POTOM_000310 [Populus tomentosa]|uniref:Protein kinase domain-containing protein n=1 Tax=Populus tomentosa TaxID=118781 RepID=A0A8X8AKX9_POPTO|nr:hypothetical protein POTOM_000310 [Populus tomentosa]